MGSGRRLDDYLRGRLKRALDELAKIEPDVILSENADVLVAALLGKHMPTEIRVDWDVRLGPGDGDRHPVQRPVRA